MEVSLQNSWAIYKKKQNFATVRFTSWEHQITHTSTYSIPKLLYHQKIHGIIVIHKDISFFRFFPSCLPMIQFSCMLPPPWPAHTISLLSSEGQVHNGHIRSWHTEGHTSPVVCRIKEKGTWHRNQKNISKFHLGKHIQISITSKESGSLDGLHDFFTIGFFYKRQPLAFKYLHLQSKAQLALGGWQHFSHCLRCTGGTGNDVASCCTSTTPVFGRHAIHGLLSGGVGVDGGHQTFLNSNTLLQQNMANRSQAIGGTGRVGHHIHGGLVVLSMVHTTNQGLQITFTWAAAFIFIFNTMWAQ